MQRALVSRPCRAPQGSVVGLTWQAGIVLDQYQYSAYGIPDGPGPAMQGLLRHREREAMYFTRKEAPGLGQASPGDAGFYVEAPGLG